MNKSSRIYIAGHSGMVGSAIARELVSLGYENLLTRSHRELDLCDKQAVFSYFEQNKPEFVFLTAAKVGGIKANMAKPVEFLVDNMQIQFNVLQASHTFGVKKVMIFSSSCIYPRDCEQPMKEEHLLSGPLEPTNEGYALSKIAALKLGEYYFKQYGMETFTIIPPNLYGLNDSFDPVHSHVLSALVKKFVDARDSGATEVPMWGTGVARREFMNVDDIARASLLLMEKGEPGTFMNVGWGTDVSIKELAELIAAKVGFKGSMKWDPSQPDGMLRKCMDVSKMKRLGYRPAIDLNDGVAQMIKYYEQKKSEGKIQ